jgi:prevent-host-death family protein
MTYMNAESSEQARRVPIRELQQNAARIIRDLSQTGETAEITNRGRVVARLVPVSPAEQAFKEMIARGEISQAQSGRDLSEIQPFPERADGVSPSDALIRMREEERW